MRMRGILKDYLLFDLVIIYYFSTIFYNIGAGIDKKDKEKMRNVHSENHSNIPENRPEEVDGEVKIEVKDEDDDEEDVDNLCKQCGVVFPSEIALVKHQVDVNDRMLKVGDIGEEEVNELLSSGLNKTKVKTVLK